MPLVNCQVPMKHGVLALFTSVCSFIACLGISKQRCNKIAVMDCSNIFSRMWSCVRLVSLVWRPQNCWCRSTFTNLVLNSATVVKNASDKSTLANSPELFVNFMNLGLIYDVTNVVSSFMKDIIRGRVLLVNFKAFCWKSFDGRTKEGCLLWASLDREVPGTGKSGNSKVVVMLKRMFCFSVFAVPSLLQLLCCI